MKILLTGLFVLVMLTGCATLSIEQPQLVLKSINPVKISTTEAVFDLHVVISNPNKFPLPIESMRYQLAINDVGVMQGSSANLETVPANGSQHMTLKLGVNLLSTPKLFFELVKNTNKQIHYSFTGNIALQGPLPSLKLIENGVVPLNI